MPATLDRIRKSMDVQPTARDRGLQLTLRIVAYDNGMIELDGVPINEGGLRQPYDEADGWLGTVATAAATIHEFRRQVQKRKATQGHFD